MGCRSATILPMPRYLQSIAEAQNWSYPPERGCFQPYLTFREYISMSVQKKYQCLGLYASLLFAEHCFVARIAELHQAKSLNNPVSGSV